MKWKRRKKTLLCNDMKIKTKQNRREQKQIKWESKTV